MERIIRISVCMLLLAGMVFAGAPAQAEAYEGLQIHIFSIGKADAILLMTEGGTVLIDCGESGDGKVITQYLKKQGIEKLDVLIITHFDKDHVGGAAKVLKSLPVDRVLQSNCLKDSKEMEKYIKALELTGMEAETVREATAFSLGGAEFTVYPPELEVYAKDESNNSSLVTEVRYGENAFLFTGDSESARLAEILAMELTEYDVLQIPHHGGWDMLLVNLVKRTNPDYALITSSEEEPEDMRTLELLRQESVEALLSREGEIDLFSDGVTVEQTGAEALRPAA